MKLSEYPYVRYTRRVVGGGEGHDLYEKLTFTYWDTESTWYAKYRDLVNDIHFCFATTTHIAKTGGTVSKSPICRGKLWEDYDLKMGFKSLSRKYTK